MSPLASVYTRTRPFLRPVRLWKAALRNAKYEMWKHERSSIEVRRSGERNVKAERQSLCLFVVVSFGFCFHRELTLHRNSTFSSSIDSNRMFSSEIFLSSVLGGFLGGIFIWLLMKILESGKNGLDVPQKIPREHDERQ